MKLHYVRDVWKLFLIMNIPEILPTWC